VADHESHRPFVGELGRHDQVALVLARFVVGDDHEFGSAQRRERAFDAGVLCCHDSAFPRRSESAAL
jgi:hypothetical protein